MDEYDRIVFNSSIILKVKKDARGLRQQEAVFQHINNLALLIDSLSDSIDISKIHTISVSSKPRNIDGSYMPVFVVGKNQAFILSRVLNTKYIEFSHQEGHIAAGLINCTHSMDKFLALHLSGGTTEILYVEDRHDNFNIDIIGGSLDISFGQLIDRIGVYLGLSFPCGREMEVLSKEGQVINLNVPISIKEGQWSNLSGLEQYFIKLIDSRLYKYQDIILTLFYTISKIIKRLIDTSVANYNIKDILITGGVAANSYIRNYLSGDNTRNYIFPLKELSTDNAVGIAYLGKIKKGHRVCDDEASKG